MEWQCFLVEKTGNVKNVTTSSYDYQMSEWKRHDTGELFFCDSWDLPIGAMYFWECWDIHRDDAGNEIARYKGTGQWNNDDGRHLIVQVPGKDADGNFTKGRRWDVDNRCSNCTLPDDRTHRCWVRSGTPPQVDVAKNGYTCSAGAGSILTEDWHGFLRNGKLITC